MSCKANPNQPASVHDRPIHLACSKGFTNVVNLLLAADADREKQFVIDLLIFAFRCQVFSAKLKDDEGNGVLHFCCRAGHINLLDLLLQKKYKIATNEANIYEDTALHV